KSRRRDQDEHRQPQDLVLPVGGRLDFLNLERRLRLMRAALEFGDRGEIKVAAVNSAGGNRPKLVAARVRQLVLHHHYRLPHLRVRRKPTERGGESAAVPQSASEAPGIIQQMPDWREFPTLEPGRR